MKIFEKTIDKSGFRAYNVLNLIKYHVERNDNSFKNEAINIARYFDSIGDDQLAEYIMSMIAESNMYAPQGSDFESEFLQQMDTRVMEPLNLPAEITKSPSFCAFFTTSPTFTAFPTAVFWRNPSATPLLMWFPCWNRKSWNRL